jgi:hypothetical protein
LHLNLTLNLVVAPGARGGAVEVLRRRHAQDKSKQTDESKSGDLLHACVSLQEEASFAT